MVRELVREGGGEGKGICSSSSSIAGGGVEQVGEGRMGGREGKREEVDFIRGAVNGGFIDGRNGVGGGGGAAAAGRGMAVLPVVEDEWNAPVLLGVGSGVGELLEGGREGG